MVFNPMWVMAALQAVQALSGGKEQTQEKNSELPAIGKAVEAIVPIVAQTQGAGNNVIQTPPITQPATQMPSPGAAAAPTPTPVPQGPPSPADDPGWNQNQIKWEEILPHIGTALPAIAPYLTREQQIIRQGSRTVPESGGGGARQSSSIAPVTGAKPMSAAELLALIQGIR